jgi:hypothetical protein
LSRLEIISHHRHRIVCIFGSFKREECEGY